MLTFKFYNTIAKDLLKHSSIIKYMVNFRRSEEEDKKIKEE